MAGIQGRENPGCVPRPKAGACRGRAYERYVSTHLLPAGVELSRRAFAGLTVAFDHWYGPWLPTDTGAAVVDVACGNGSFLHYLQHKGYRNARGIDASREQVAAARALGVTNVEAGDAVAHLAARPEVYDLVGAHDFVEHLTKDEVVDFLDAAHAALKPGGRVLISTINGESPFAGKARYDDLTHEMCFTARSLEQALRVVGFDEIAIRPRGPVAHGLRSALRVGLWKIIEAALKAYLLVETGSAGSGVLTLYMFGVGRKPPSETAGRSSRPVPTELTEERRG